MPTSSTTSPSTHPSAAETLESDLLAHLASTSTLEDLHATLLCSLQRLGWTDKIRRLALELLRAGRCDRFDEVVAAVVASAEGRKHPVFDVAGSDDDSGAEPDGGYFSALENVDVRIPESVVEQGVRAIKDALREMVILEDDIDGSNTTNTAGGDSATQGDKALHNGDSSPAKKEKKTKPGKQVK